jgi:hypothetical protein
VLIDATQEILFAKLYLSMVSFRKIIEKKGLFYPLRALKEKLIYV